MTERERERVPFVLVTETTDPSFEGLYPLLSIPFVTREKVDDKTDTRYFYDTFTGNIVPDVSFPFQFSYNVPRASFHDTGLPPGAVLTHSSLLS